MGGEHDNLDGRLVTSLYRRVLGQRYLREADRSWVRVVGGTKNLELRNHGEGHVGRATVWAVIAESHVDVGKGSLVASEPSRLEGDGSSSRGPVRAVLCYVVSATCARVNGGYSGEKLEETSHVQGYVHCMP